MDEKNVTRIGWFASVMAITMYFSYIDQIMLNLSGHPGSVILPVVTTVSCTTWAMYGTFKAKRDWPLIVCNVPGIFLGLITAITALI